MTGKVRRYLLLLAAGVALLAICRSDVLLFEAPARLADQTRNGIGRRLRKYHNLRFLVTFDEAKPREWIHRQPTHAPGTEIVAGRIGRARRFNGNQYTYMETAVPWSDLGDRYSLAIWAKLKQTKSPQTIWYANYDQRETGFQLRDGHMRFHIPDGDGGGQTLSYPFTAYGRFVHLAAVVEGPGGKAHLYENGVLKASCPLEKISLPHQNMEFGKWRWYAVTEPLHGSLDEAAAWNCALSPRAIKNAARARLSLPVKKTPILYGLWRLLEAHRNAPAIVLKMLDRFNPFLHEGKLTANGLPAINLLFSPRDSRHFIHGHDLSLAAGRRIKDAARSRRIIAQYAEQTVDAELCLAGSDTHYAPTKRAGYILQLPPDAPFQGSSHIRLIPPEAMADNLLELAAASAPSTNGNINLPLCRLHINGLPKGVYYYEPFEISKRPRPPASTLFMEPLSPGDWSLLFRPPAAGQAPAAPLWPDTSENLKSRLRELQNLLSHDRFHPWSRREWSWRIRRATQDLPTCPPLPTATALLGDNPAPEYILADLDVAALSTHGWTLHSSRPDIIATDGRVIRPGTIAPIAVTLTLHSAEQPAAPPLAEFNFRVMPRQRSWPAIFISCTEPPAYNRRVDFQATFYATNQDNAPLRLSGGQATSGGLKYRGNTSYWRGRKKPFSLRFDESAQLIGQRASRYLYLLNGYVDVTKLRNKLAYDFFRDWGTPENPRHAPEIGWAEVFVNGQYLGIYEMCTRVDGDMLDYASDPLDPGAVLYKMRYERMLFALPQTSSFDQAFPRPNQERRDAPLQELVAFTSQTDTPEFVRDIGKHLDIANAIDFLLLLNFSGNMDGRTTNFYLSRGGHPGARFFFIPWDYDHTFNEHRPWLSNHLFDRLRDESPDFMEQVRARWQQLRANEVSNEAIDQRIQTMAAQIADIMPWEILQEPGAPTFEENIEELRKATRRNAETLDHRLNQPKE